MLTVVVKLDCCDLTQLRSKGVKDTQFTILDNLTMPVDPVPRAVEETRDDLHRRIDETPRKSEPQP